MARYSDTLVDQNGKPVAGAIVTIITKDGQLAVLTNDSAGPISNPFIVGDTGFFYFNAIDAVYDAQFRFGGRLIREDEIIVGEPPEFVGPPGGSNNTRANLAQLKAAATTDLTSLYDGSLWTWTLGDFTGKADDINVVKANSTPITTGAWVRQLATGVQLNTSLNQDVHFNYDGSNPRQYGVRVDSASTTQQVDSFFALADYFGASAAGYPFHGIAYADAGVGPFKVGGGGFAVGGPGPGSGVVGNRREDGGGNGVIGTRDGSGGGSGVVGTAQGSGTNSQSGVSALKQNSTGSPGGPNCPGNALDALNSADVGYAINSITTANNAEAISNYFERRNVASGILSRFLISQDGARTGALKLQDLVLQAPTAMTGSSPVVGGAVTISAAITGSSEATGYSVSNAATGGTSAYGFTAAVTGANALNTGIFVTVSGGTVNRAAYFDGDVLTSGYILASADAVKNIGSAGQRFNNGYFAGGVITTSDERLKDWQGGLTDAHLRAARRIGAELGLYQWKDGSRVHVGARAQRVAQIMVEEGLESAFVEGERPNFQHAFLCYDEWDDVVEDGVVTIHAGNRFSLREGELALFLAAGQEARLAALEAA